MSENLDMENTGEKNEKGKERERAKRKVLYLTLQLNHSAFMTNVLQFIRGKCYWQFKVSGL